MSKIHVTSPSGNEIEYDEEQLRSMWEQGLLDSDTQYWKEGMSEWQALSEYFTSEVSSPPSALISSPQFAYIKDPKSLTSFLIFMLWISLGIEVVSMLGDFAQMALLDGDSTPAEEEANGSRQGMIGIIYIGVYLVTVVAFLKWVYRASVNCRGFSSQDMRFTPGWSVGYYFIPFLNLFRPYQSMKEIWHVSHGPLDYDLQKRSALLGWWWALWLISNFVGQAAGRLALNADTIDELRFATFVSILSSLITMLLCIVAMALIKSIANRQEELVRNG